MDAAGGRRERLVDAALTVLADSGARALTHRAVDAAAGVPMGSTSNVFRTRALLIDGVVARLLELDHHRMSALGARMSGASAAEFVIRTVADRRTVLARIALSADPDACALGPAREQLVDILDGLARAAGRPFRPEGARLLVAAIDGIVLDAARRGTAPDAAQLAAALDAMGGALADPDPDPNPPT